MDIRLTTLGTPAVHLGQREITSLPGKPVSFGVFVFLALEEEATRDRLVSVFWPEKSQERSRHTLSQTLYELRQELGEAWLESSGNTVRVTSSLHVDAREFEVEARQGHHEEALALYHGHFLEGVHLAATHPFEEWLERERARLKRKHRAAADAFIREARSRGNLEDALGAAWRWATLDPLDDGGQHHLIALLAESGRRTEALVQYDRYEQRLGVELGLEPLDETRALIERVRSSGSWPDSPPSAAPDAPAVSDQEPEPPLLHRMDDELAPSLQVLRPIGKGSMAEVFLAREPYLKRLVAVKVLSPRLAGDPRARKRFEREAQAAARLNHPHVCTVHRVGTLSDGTPYLVTPFVKGTTLAQRLRSEGRLGPAEVRRVLREMASALAAAHKLGILHRDVRPGNVLRADENGRHSLCDFGVAGVLETGEEQEPRLTRTGEVLGHPDYMSPEQLEGQPLTDRADIYSLGITAHELVTGHPPPPAEEHGWRPGRKAPAVDLGPLTEYLADSDPNLADLIGRCLAQQPAHRPSAADLERLLAEGATSPAGPSLANRSSRTLLSRLVERRFLQIIGGYIAGGFLALEAVSQLEGYGYVPAWAYPLALTTVVFGFFAANILAWYHGKKGNQTMPPRERWLLGLVGLGWILACALVAL